MSVNVPSLSPQASNLQPPASSLLTPVAAWCRVTVREIWRLRILQVLIAVYVLALLAAGWLKADGTELGWAQLVIKRFEAAAFVMVMLTAAIIAAYVVSYEEMQRGRILLTGSLPLSRAGMLAGTAAGVFVACAAALALLLLLLGVRVLLGAGADTREHLAGRVRMPVKMVQDAAGNAVEGAVRPDGSRELGVATLAAGESARIVVERPERPAFVRFMLFAGGRHSIWARVYFEGYAAGAVERERLTLDKYREVRVPAGEAGKQMVLVVENAGEGVRVSLPVAQVDMLVEVSGFWGNLLRCYAARALVLLYAVLLAAGCSGFMGFASALAVTLSMLLGAYLSPMVSGFFQLPRFTEGYVEVARSWLLLPAAGNLFGDLAHASPADRLPMGALVPLECLKLGGLMALRGAIVIGIGGFIFSRREVAA